MFNFSQNNKGRKTEIGERKEGEDELRRKEKKNFSIWENYFRLHSRQRKIFIKIDVQLELQCCFQYILLNLVSVILISGIQGVFLKLLRIWWVVRVIACVSWKEIRNSRRQLAHSFFWGGGKALFLLKRYFEKCGLKVSYLRYLRKRIWIWDLTTKTTCWLTEGQVT